MKNKVQKFVQDHKEVVQTIAVVLGVIIIIGGLFIISEKTGDRSLDKAAGAISETETNPLLEEGQVLDEEKMKEITKITYDEFKTYLKKKTTTVIMLGYDSCYWCKQQEPILKNVMYEYNVDVKYLDVSALDSEQLEELEALHNDLAGFGTPTFISVKSKKVKKVSTNAKAKTELVEMLTDMGLIKEEKEK